MSIQNRHFNIYVHVGVCVYFLFEVERVNVPVFAYVDLSKSN